MKPVAMAFNKFTCDIGKKKSYLPSTRVYANCKNGGCKNIRIIQQSLEIILSKSLESAHVLNKQWRRSN
jgi:hypothetical protein